MREGGGRFTIYWDAGSEPVPVYLDAIYEHYGSVDAFLRDGLKVSDAERVALQERLLR